MSHQTEIENLGVLAAQYELWAASPEVPYWEKSHLVERAREYRRQQDELLKAGLGKCVTEGCYSLTTEVQCESCRNQKPGISPALLKFCACYLGIFVGVVAATIVAHSVWHLF